MKSELVKTLSLKQPPDYIRGKASMDYVSELAEVLASSPAWPFPPLAIQPIPADHKDRAEGEEYWIIDGIHRCCAALTCKTAQVPAEVYSGLTPADTIALQIKLNNAHGLRLSVSSQTRAIIKLGELGMKQKDIAVKTGLSTPSISKIISGKQRGPDNPEGKPGGPEGKDGARKKVVKFDYDNWMKGLARTLKLWEKNGTRIRKGGFPKDCSAAMDLLYSTIVDVE